MNEKTGPGTSFGNRTVESMLEKSIILDPIAVAVADVYIHVL